MKRSLYPHNSRDAWRILGTIFATILISVTSLSTSIAQEAGESVATPVIAIDQVPPDIATEPVAEDPVVSELAEPAESEFEESDQAGSDQAGVELDQADDGEVEPTPTPSPPALDFWLPVSADCGPFEAATGNVLAAGTAVEYRCEYVVEFAGSAIAVDQFNAAFSVFAALPTGTSMRFLGDPTSSNWSLPSGGTLQISPDQVDSGSIEIRVDSTDESGSSIGAVVFSFALLAERSQCVEAAGRIEVTVTPEFSTVGDGIVMSVHDPGQATEIIEPVLPAVDFTLPSISIESISMAPIGFSLVEQSLPAVIRLVVDHPVFACLEYAVALAFDFDGASSVSVSASSAPNAPILPASGEEGSSFVVGYTTFGTERGQISYDITIEVTIPAALMVGDFGMSAIASIAPVSG